MKKIVSVLLALLLLISIIPASTAMANELSTEDTIVLSPSDFTVSHLNYTCNVSGNVVTGKEGAKYPAFDIAFKNEYAIESILIKLTIANNNLNFRINPGGSCLMYSDEKLCNFGSYTNNFTNSTTTEQTYAIPTEYNATSVNKLRVAGEFLEGSQYLNTTITIESITIIGSQLTETVVLEKGDFTLSNYNNCTISENVMTSVANQYPTFYVELGKDYYVKSVSITATPTGRNYTNGASGLQLRKDKKSVFNLKLKNQYWTAGSTSSKTSAVDTEYTTIAVNQIYFGGRWGGTGAPEAGGATLTIDKIEITCWKNPLDDVVIGSNDITVTEMKNCTVNENVVTASKISPKFLVTLPEAYYATSIDVSLTNDYEYGLGWSNGTRNNLDLIFEDGTSVAATVTDPSSAYWKAQIPQKSSGTVNIVIPEAYRSKKIVGIEMEGYFPAEGATIANDGSITVTGVEINGVPDSLATKLVETYNNPETNATGVAMYNNAFVIYKNVVSSFFADSKPILNSVSVIDDKLSYYNGKLVANVSAPYQALLSADYYVSEIGIIGIPSSTLGEAELLVTTEGVQTVSVSFAKGDNTSAYKNFVAPFVGNAEYVGQDITIRAFVKYTNGTEEIVYYSENATDDETISNGIGSAALPEIKADVTGVIGNINADEEINILDLIRLKKLLCDIDVEFNFVGADCNADGVVNSMDLTKMRVYLLTDGGLPTEPYADSFVTK